MKPSKAALLHYVAGLSILCFAGVITIVTSDEEAIKFGLSGLCLLWIMGIMHDLYNLYGKET